MPQIKPREYEDWMKNSDEKFNVRAFPRCTKAVLNGEGLLTYVNNNRTESSNLTLYSKRWLWWHDLHPAPEPRRGVLLGILGRGVPPGSLNPDLISDKKCHFPHQFSDQISKIHTYFRTWPNLACSRLGSQIVGESPQFSLVLFSCSSFLNSADPTQCRSLEQVRSN